MEFDTLSKNMAELEDHYAQYKILNEREIGEL